EISTGRAMDGPRAELYRTETFEIFRRRLAAFEPDLPERLADPVFQRPEPETLVIDEVESLWAPIADEDDWAPFHAKLERIEAAGRAYALGSDGDK
ncbi:hypothetical protein ACWTQY_32035, partial [Klebsiella pneumoniae]